MSINGICLIWCIPFFKLFGRGKDTLCELDGHNFRANVEVCVVVNRMGESKKSFTFLNLKTQGLMIRLLSFSCFTSLF